MKNKIFNEDCIGEKGMCLIEDKSIDFILCDLPYGTTASKWDNIIDFTKLWIEYERIIKDNGVIALFGSQPFTSSIITSNLKLFKYEWIWEKNTGLGFQHAKNMPLKIHENICIFSKAPMGHLSLLEGKRMNYNPIGVSFTGNISKVKEKAEGLGKRPNQVGVLYKSMQNYPKSILKVAADKIIEHPTQKPVKLCEYLIKTYTKETDIVLDNCIGSGTTAIACLNTNRIYIGFENDEKNFLIAEKRIKNHIIQKELF